jgi:hypothetical protein
MKKEAPSWKNTKMEDAEQHIEKTASDTSNESPNHEQKIWSSQNASSEQIQRMDFKSERSRHCRNGLLPDHQRKY